MDTNLCETKIDFNITYDGLLNDHKEYLRMLDILEDNSSFIGITSGHELIDLFKNDIIKEEKTDIWWGNASSKEETIYFIKSSKELFNSLRKYETFCKMIFKDDGTFYNETTDFGISDIAFFDERGKLLLYTVTHEGFISVDSMINKFFKLND